MSWKYAHHKEYVTLVRQFPLAPISSKSQHYAAIAVIKTLALKENLTPAESDYFGVLSQLIEAYEKKDGHASTDYASVGGAIPDGTE